MAQLTQFDPTRPFLSRRGPKSKATTEAAIELAYLLICQGVPKYVIKSSVNALVKRDFPEGMSQPTFEKVLSRAHAILAETNAKAVDRNQLRCDSRRFYESIIADPRVDARTKVRARKAMDELDGLPIHNIIHSGTGRGGAIAVEHREGDFAKMSEEDLLKLREECIAGKLKPSAN